MQLPEDPISRFVLRLVLWLPPCFAAWYLFGGALLMPLALVVDGVLQVVMTDVFRSLTMEGRAFQFDTQLIVRAADGRSGSLMFALNPLSYTWNLPVLAALLLAGPTGRASPKRILIAYTLLLLAWTWGVCCQFAKTTVFDLGPEVAAQIGTPGPWLDLLALAYQFGVLILPAMALILIWLLLARSDLQYLAGDTPTPISTDVTHLPPLPQPSDPMSRRQKQRRRRATR
ncbi:MAG: hypothetical protein M3O62_12035 [Pseudomonadota bacterium]|nr:hypothetical protein [Pseudomonadota bacterium]